MAKNWPSSLAYFLILAPFLLCCHSQEYDADRKIHVVYMGELPENGVSAASLHQTMLEDVLGSSAAAKESLVYSYGRSFNGFAAKLSPEEVESFSEMDQVVSVFPNTAFKLHTTRSWDFMGFTQNQTLRSSNESDVIIGVIDTGVWPESESFSDEGFPPPPVKWKGRCQNENNFTCNNKLIGARYYNAGDFYLSKDFHSPRDAQGHGTHTASTAAGREVAGASFYGLAEGIARGAVPNARIAIYKVCWTSTCYVSDLMAAFDDAIADGVDVLTISIGPGEPIPYFLDPIGIGAFHAMKKGILTANSAGNSGPYSRSVVNVAPWTLTVAASSIDRKFVTQIALGNGDIIIGNSINAFTLNETDFPLIYAGDAPNVSSRIRGDYAGACYSDYLDSNKAQGKIVLCDYLWDGSGPYVANSVGAIMPSDGYADYSFSYILPATRIDRESSAKIMDYIRSSNNPTATILTAEAMNDTSAPRVVSFSSRGPNLITPDILKPDLTAPGVNILAAWSVAAPPSFSLLDKRQVAYNIISGTSMSCPHAGGAAAYLKSIHPNWSPAAIKSALMTTAHVMDPRNNEDAEFAYGSGHINPAKAVDPGLVYDATEQDYINFLCKQGYNSSVLRLVTQDRSNCTTNTTGKAWDLNYPSFALSIQDGQPIIGYFPRTVTNVGSSNSTYHAIVQAPSSLNITVKPWTLSFSAVGEKKSFKVEVHGGVISQQAIISASIEWRDGVHVVRSPLAVYTVLSTGSPLGVTRNRPIKGLLDLDGPPVNGIL
ncbi:cucumisin-like [Magnolia sinica]|uniref:cucumisin-like n=1 Tax=Magnolia sinica TaxID=86752 RepID=UPI002659C4D0|nr:cucumisin-like [Magnolia sinica]